MVAVLVSLSMGTACSSGQGNTLPDDDPVGISVTGEPLEPGSKIAKVKSGTDTEGHSTCTAAGRASDVKTYTLSIRQTANAPEAVFEYHYADAITRTGECRPSGA
ncbi:hypothetical protein EDD29_5212 [Actinocorallia herbida]|uniref:Uncharacterized protein n=1 Tax=Actinocorallia herbida TaxID=58109 RepID=A0A3N1D284_9ACTN|nr:hypothetical protein EDD29_5212 [Actinocorallia herbida]